jgi:anti-sigma factor ChrR (cupin superfamily)
MRYLLAVALSLSAATAAPQDTSHAVSGLPDGLTWGPAPRALPPGSRLAVLEGSPSEAGPFTMRVLLPAGYRIPPHYHAAREHVTVLTGTFDARD